MTARHQVECARGQWGRIALGLLGYNLALLVVSPILIAWLLWRVLIQRKRIGSWGQRLGFAPRPPVAAHPRVWLHAVSAGEMAALQPVLEALRAARPDSYLAVSTVTETGMAVAQSTCRAADSIFYLPFDWADCMALALWRVRPELVVVAEKELWPNLLGLARLLGMQTLVINGRVSDRMMWRARRARSLVRWLYELPSCLCVQSPLDAERLEQIGVPAARVVVAGNTKADGMAERDGALEARLAQALGVSADEVWLVAGSTHAGEEEAVAEAFTRIRAKLPRARLLLAPRHLERVAEVSAVLAQRGLPVVRRSEAAGLDDAIVILDTMGELRSAYALGAGCFVGGTLTPIGGHNPLEPVAVGRPALFGPYTANCSDVADLVVNAGVGFRITGAEDLAAQFLRLVTDAALRDRIARDGPALIAAQRGAAPRCANIAVAMLEEKPSDRPR